MGPDELEEHSDDETVQRAADSDLPADDEVTKPMSREHLAALLARRDSGAAETVVQKLVGERYRIERVAGSGGMGCVFSATDTVLQRRVAIKVLILPGEATPSEAEPDSPEPQRILAEARAMAGLRHPNLCRVHEVSVSGALPFIIMDWIDGVDVRTAWRNTDLKHRLSLLVKIVDAVADSSRRGRDPRGSQAGQRAGGSPGRTHHRRFWSGPVSLRLADPAAEGGWHAGLRRPGTV